MPQEEILIRSADLPTFTPAGGTLRMLAGGGPRSGHDFGCCRVPAKTQLASPPSLEWFSNRRRRKEHGIFTVGDSEVEAGPGDIVVIPANAWHSFRNDGDEWLRVVGADEGARHDAELAPSTDD